MIVDNSQRRKSVGRYFVNVISSGHLDSVADDGGDDLNCIICILNVIFSVRKVFALPKMKW